MVHGANDVRTLGVLSTQEAIEHIRQSPSMVQVVQDDDEGKVGTVVLTLLADVGQICSQVLASLVVNTEGKIQ